MRQGSYASSASPFGARPASGLSRRRGQFKGPPPSFYRSGGWGSGPQGEKRRAEAEATARRSSSASGTTYTGGGFGFGQGQSGFSNDVPHFDRESHHRTQEQQDRRRKRRMREEAVEFDDGSSTLYRFLLLSGIIGVVSTPLLFSGY